MVEHQQLNEDSPAVQAHITVMQGVIQRMAENSRSCKVWCVTLVAAVLVLVARTGEPQHALIALAPTVPLLLLDSYYLALERAFIASQNAFVVKLHEDTLERNDLFRVAPKGMGSILVIRCLFGSMSILPFYLPVIATVLIAGLVIL